MTIEEINDLVDLGYTKEEAERYLMALYLREVVNKEYARISKELEKTLRQRYFDTVLNYLRMLCKTETPDNIIFQIQFDIDDTAKTYQLTNAGQYLLQYRTDEHIVLYDNGRMQFSAHRQDIEKMYMTSIRRLYSMYKMFETYKLQP